MGQTDQRVQIRFMFRGLHWQLVRTTALLLPIFSVFDVLRRKTTVLSTLAGNFAVTFGVVGLSYAFSWPLETLKNLAQAGKPFPGANISERVRYMGGVRGLFRGMTPGHSAPITLWHTLMFCFIGATGGGLRNACGVIGMVYSQQIATFWGLRDE